MSRYITYEDRVVLESMLKHRQSITHISEVLHFSRKSIYAEIKKGLVHGLLNYDYTTFSAYSAHKAQDITDYRKTSHGCDLKIGNNHLAALKISQYVRSGYSPYAVSVMLKREGIISLSKSTIYNYIYGGVLDVSNSFLIMGRRKKSHTIVSRKHRRLMGTSIERRPDNILLRDSFGHWEMDTVQPRIGYKSCYLVFTERYSRYEIISKMPNKETATMLKTLRRIIKAHKGIFKTITCDNGSEFASAPEIEKMGISVYFCHPNSSFERGSNENQNRFIRRRYPKGTHFEKVTSKEVVQMQNFINTYPRAIFGGLSSQDIFNAVKDVS